MGVLEKLCFLVLVVCGQMGRTMGVAGPQLRVSSAIDPTSETPGAHAVCKHPCVCRPNATRAHARNTSVATIMAVKDGS